MQPKTLRKIKGPYRLHCICPLGGVGVPRGRPARCSPSNPGRSEDQAPVKVISLALRKCVGVRERERMTDR